LAGCFLVRGIPNRVEEIVKKAAGLSSAEMGKEIAAPDKAKKILNLKNHFDVLGVGPAYSTRKALEKASLTLGDIDLIEANEAFAAQSLAVGKLPGWDASKVNVNGGAIALGHPVGASGARILVTLLYEMEKRDVRRGLATLCAGGGMGVSTIVERVKYYCR
jgi:acetyl-CoA C-acetyltransferase